MLGGLARWLRLAGYDTSFDTGLDDHQLAAASRQEGRWLLTRDRVLAAHAGPRVVLLRALDTAAQVTEVVGRLDLRLRSDLCFTRCSRCNGRLEDVARESVAEVVPPWVAAHTARFSRCPGCGQVYWAGSHQPRIKARLEACFAVTRTCPRTD